MSFDATGRVGGLSAASSMASAGFLPDPAVIVVSDATDAAAVPRLEAELDGRITVGTQVLVADVEGVKLFDSAVLGVLASAAHHLHEERSGSLVLRNPSGPFMRQLRLMRLDHMFELEI